MWTRFYDMSSGGGRKLQWNFIYIEAGKKDAIRVFGELFGRDPENVTCRCCGGDYSINEYPSLEDASSYERRERTLETYVTRSDVKVLRETDIPKNLLHPEADLI